EISPTPSHSGVWLGSDCRQKTLKAGYTRPAICPHSCEPATPRRSAARTPRAFHTGAQGRRDSGAPWVKAAHAIKPQRGFTTAARYLSLSFQRRGGCPSKSLE